MYSHYIRLAVSMFHIIAFDIGNNGSLSNQRLWANLDRGLVNLTHKITGKLKNMEER